MPAQIGLVRPQFRGDGNDESPITPNEFVELVRDTVWREDHGVVVAESHQTAIEEPVRGTGQRDAIADGIGTIRLDRTDVGRLHLRPTAPLSNRSPVTAHRFA